MGRAQQHKNCGPHDSSGFMQRVIGSYRVSVSRGRRGYGQIWVSGRWLGKGVQGTGNSGKREAEFGGTGGVTI